MATFQDKLLGDDFNGNSFLEAVDIGQGIFIDALNFDARFLSPEYWKFDARGNMTNAWISFYTGEELTAFEIIEGELQTGSDVSTITGVSIKLSNSPKIVETQVKGLNSRVYTEFTNNGYDLTVEFTEAGPTFWQQNSRKIKKLTDVLQSQQIINVSNPQLNLIHGINKLVYKGMQIGQHAQFYNQNPISITFSTVLDVDILSPINQT